MTRASAKQYSNPSVVALGASAGGLEALKRFFRAMPADTGAAFVVLQHLSPDSPSHLATLLSHETSMSVETVENRRTLRANHVYVIPPARQLITSDGTIEALEPEAGQRPPKSIDRFFRTLARSHGRRAGAVILSGTGSDGALGLKSVKAAGGLVLAQDPGDAEQDGMPRSAAATGKVDRVLRVEGLVDSLERFLKTVEPAGTEQDQHQAFEGEDLATILRLLYEHKGVDFDPYKAAMLSRRISRRIALLGLDSAADYQALLADDPKELDQLYQDLLVSVTDFFRDRDSFAALRDQAVPDIISQRAPDEAIRVWVPGCATGEEAYSIAILLMEGMTARGHTGPLQLFATDVDERALAVARAGVYPPGIAADVDPDYLQRYFQQSDNHYRVSKALRERVIFARHDLLSDPPYSRLDLLSCRNLLIYLDASAQHDVLSRFHFALREPGYLFLGNAENINNHTQLFLPIDSRQSLYRRRETATPPTRPLLRSRTLHRTPEPRPSAPPPGDHQLDQATQRLMLQEYVPATILANQQGEVLRSYGPTGDYLALPTGTPRLDVLEMAPEPLESTLRIALHKVRDDNDLVQLHTSDDEHGTRITIRPLRRPSALKDMLLITFEPMPSTATMPAPSDAEAETREEQLREALRVTRSELEDKIHALGATNEQLQAYNEEILSMNEELQSMNEELQSTNEELETSKEEVQSLNEELTTTNQELRHKIQALERTNDDLANVFASTQVAIVILDEQLRIQRFTPLARQLVHLTDSDLGRAITDMKLRFDDPTLLDEIKAVLRDWQEREQELIAEDGTWYRRRITTYRNNEDTVCGVIITLTDINALKTAEIEARDNEQRWRALANAVPTLIGHVHADSTLDFGNTELTKWLGVEPEKLHELKLSDVLQNGKMDATTLENYIQKALNGHNVGFETRVGSNGADERELHVALVPVSSENDHNQGCYAIINDITERKQHEAQRLQQIDDFVETHRLVSLNEMAATLAHQLNQPLGSIRNYAATLEKGAADDERTARLARSIDQQVGAASEVIKAMRGFIRERTPHTTEIDLNAVIRRVITLTEGRQRTTGTTIETRLSDELPAVHVNATLLEQALLNLMINAMEAMTDSERRELTLSNHILADEESIEIRVTDTGPGISGAELSRLFEPFYTTKANGMGMGLAITKGIIEQHGGSLTVDSTKGKGSSFQIRLPIQGDRP